MERDTANDPKLSVAEGPLVVLRRLRLPPRYHSVSASRGSSTQTTCQARPGSLDPLGSEHQRPSDVEAQSSIHGGEKPFVGSEDGQSNSTWKCGDCGKGFRFPSLLEIHRRSHTGERPFICSVCGKGYVSSSAMVTHQRVHTRQKPYTCPVCKMWFPAMYLLKAHRPAGQVAHNMVKSIWSLVFCAIHVVETHSRVIQFTEKSMKKSEECAAKWVEVEKCLESKVAAQLLQRKEYSQVMGLAQHCEETGAGRGQQCIPGYHADCYRHFCNITTINRAIARSQRNKVQSTDAEKPEAGESPQEAVPDGEADEPASKRLLRNVTSDGQQAATVQHPDHRHVLPVHCIICKSSKYIIKKATGKRRVEKLVRCETKQGGPLMTAATMKKDEALLLLIRDRDLVAIEVRYHKSCYLRYTKVVTNFVKMSEQDDEQQVYEKSYSSFCKRVIEERIIRGKEILRLAKLNKLFIVEVREVEGLDASSHKTGCLKARLKRSHPVLCFTRPFRPAESEIVFVESFAVEELVEGVVQVNSTEAGESNETVGESQQGGSSSHHLRDVFHAAQIVQNSIANSTNPIRCPPTSEDTTLHKAEEVVPDELYNILAWTSGASNEPKESGKVKVPDEMHHRLLSIAQDIMRLRAEGRILLPKHTP
ncbi:uncharacterized protein LOC116981512 isoform X1 [Amblyraja radiata]|uniref:uncharacterized protein LOC116981512 isoform X1 n=1 Tax=Amblyraja radiata TaxID=386614 RepID=UPI001403B701|nr:uncharacterized protein LOC116981512 isoform X1 [Amblyraja radiata]XP_032890463.1 uncharacterized protein LOC116981512 isoform X1 [Amblyraja radiata]